VLMIGKHPEKLALVERRGIATCLLDDAAQLLQKTGRRVDMVVECSGAAQGLELALQLVRPRGVVMLKSTVALKSALHLAPIVIDEIRVQGSRCGPLAPALRALSQRTIDVSPLISASYPLDDALAAFACAAQPGVLKVLMHVYKPGGQPYDTFKEVITTSVATSG
jgi:threonine dehydrogenase-like Zn-dependent dehydrogenase